MLCSYAQKVKLQVSVSSETWAHVCISQSSAEMLHSFELVVEPFPHSLWLRLSIVCSAEDHLSWSIFYWTSTRTHARACKRARARTYTHTHAHTRTHAHTHTHTRTRTHTHTHTNVRTRTHAHAHTHTHTHLHTHARTHAQHTYTHTPAGHAPARSGVVAPNLKQSRARTRRRKRGGLWRPMARSVGGTLAKGELELGVGASAKEGEALHPTSRWAQGSGQAPM